MSVYVGSARSYRELVGVLLVFGWVMCPQLGSAGNGRNGPVPLGQPDVRDRNIQTVVGQSTISGIVVTRTDAPEAIRRAIVKLAGGDQINRSAITDNGGRFVFREVPAGKYSLSASKPGFVTSVFGATNVGDPGVFVVLRSGGVLSDLKIAMARGAVVSGTVRNEMGEAAESVRVFVARAEALTQPVVGMTERVAYATTDDEGSYRLFGLVPGVYVVGAVPTAIDASEVGVLSRANVSAAFAALKRGGSEPVPAVEVLSRGSFAPIYYPSTPVAAHATPLTLVAGEEKVNIDMVLSRVPSVVLDGHIVSPDGQDASSIVVSLTYAGPPLPAGWQPSAPIERWVGAGGKFQFRNLAPGEYLLVARSTTRVFVATESGQVTAREASVNFPTWAAQPILVQGSDISGLVVQLRRGLALTGRISFTGGVRPTPGDVSRIRVTLTPSRDPGRGDVSAMAPMLGPVSAEVRADGSFEVMGLAPGRYAVTTQSGGDSNAAPWILRSAIAGGDDLLDDLLVVGDEELPDVVLTLSNRRTEITGTLTTDAGRAATNCFVLAIPEERGLRASGRRVQRTRPDTSGQFRFVNIPSGIYRIGVVTALPDDGWRSEEFLEQVAAASVRVELLEGEIKIQDLRIAK